VLAVVGSPCSLLERAPEWLLDAGGDVVLDLDY
jgi:hypothetical protein